MKLRIGSALEDEPFTPYPGYVPLQRIRVLELPLKYDARRIVKHLLTPRIIITWRQYYLAT